MHSAQAEIASTSGQPATQLRGGEVRYKVWESEGERGKNMDPELAACHSISSFVLH